MKISGPRLAQTIALALLTALGWLGGCSDGPPGLHSEDPGGVVVPPSQGLIVSDPVPAAVLAAEVGAALAPAGGAGDSVAYVSLAPGTAPRGSLAIVRRVGGAATLTTTVLDGGFDPVPVGARAGDSVEVVVTDASGGTVLQVRAEVLLARPPVVVRTDPPRKKTDVPVNAALVVVFSEPVAAGSLTPTSVQLLRGTTSIVGTVSPLQGTATAAVFTPAAPLDPNTVYQLAVTRGVRDLEGDALAADTSVEFTTGTTTVGPATRVTVLPDTVAVAIGSQVQLTPAARDTAGTPIVGRPFTWSTDNPAVASVSPAGLVTAVAEGVAHVRSELDGRSAVAAILVSQSLAAVDSVAVVPGSATLVIGGLVQLTAVLRDAAGNVLSFREIAWSSSNPAVATVSAGTGGTAVVLDVSAGTTTITATSEGKRGTATIKTGTVGPYA